VRRFILASKKAPQKIYSRVRQDFCVHLRKPYVISLLVAAMILLATNAFGFTVDARSVVAQNPVTPVPPVTVPPTASCTVTLVSNQPFGPTGDPRGFTPFVGAYAPPAGCSAPWSKVVLTVTFTVTPGTQFDRVGAIWIGDVQIFKTSTAEPTPAFGPTWSIQKDVSEYSPVLSAPNEVYAVVSNYVVDGFNSVVYMTATLTFYETSAQFQAAPHPSAIIPVSPQGSPTSPPAFFLTASNPDGSAEVALPSDSLQVFMEVYATGLSCDEFWYASQPTSFAAPIGLCGGGSFREIQVYVDGSLAAVVWPFPLINTGGWNPYLWSPIPSVNTFNTPSYVVDLTPFVSELTGGGNHEITLEVVDNYNYWMVSANLLVYEEQGAHGGQLVSNTLAPTPVVRVASSINQLSAQFNTSVSRNFTVAGYVDTASGVVTTTVRQSMNFFNGQVLNLKNSLENLGGSEIINTTVITVYPDGNTVTNVTTYSYPIAVTSAFIVPNETAKGVVFILPATVKQAYDVARKVEVNGLTVFSSSLAYSVTAQALLEVGTNLVANGQTSETYEYSNSAGVCYNHYLAAAQGLVRTSVLKSQC